VANTTGFTSTTTFSEEVLSGADFCKHVSMKKLNKGVGFFYERDSFGYVFAEIVCEACRVKGLEELGNSIEVCADCGKEHPRKETRQWRWYDFYAPQGDEPRIICNTCWDLDRHVQRMANDKLDYEREFGNEDDYLLSIDDDDDVDNGFPLDDEDDLIDQFLAEECTEEQPVVLFDVQFYRDRYYNLLNTTPNQYQGWSKCIQRVQVIAK